MLIWSAMFLVRRFILSLLFLEFQHSLATQLWVTELMILVSVAIITELRPHFEVSMRKIEMFNEATLFVLVFNTSIYSKQMQEISPGVHI